MKDSTGGVLPGVTLSLSSPDMVGGAQTATSSSDGSYRFIELPPGLYSISATLQGFRTVQRQELTVPFATTLTVDLALSPGGIAEVVTVSGESPLVDVTTASAAAKLDRQLLDALPVNPNLHGFSAFEVFTLTPGVTTGRTAHGGSRDANNLMIDGVSSTIPNRAGVNAATVAYNWIQEVQVVSLGAAAEYGDFTGAISNIVMRSGSNQFRGVLEYETTRHGWTGNNTSGLTPAQQVTFKPLNITNQSDATAQLGGPLLKDRLFFFAGLSYYYQKQVPSGSLGDTARVDKLPRFLTKLNWAAAPRIRVEGLLEHDELNVDNPKAGPTVAPEANYSSSGSKYLWNTRLTWTPNDATLVEARVGGMRIFEDVTPRSPATWDGPPGHVDRTTGIQSVNVASLLGTDKGTRNVIGASVSRRIVNRLGKSHNLKIGAESERLKYNETSRYPGGILYTDVAGKPDQATLFKGSNIQGTGTRTSLFAQDSWALTDRITLEPGVRVAINRGSVPVKGEVYSTNPVSPRLGLAWDVTGDHRTVVRAHYGRFHEALFTTLYQFLDTSQQPPTITARVLADGSFQEISRVTPATNFGIDPNVKQAFVEQYLFGVERELLKDVSVSAQYIGRKYKDIFAFTDTKSNWAPVSTRDPGPDGVANNADDGATFTVFNLLNPNQAFLLLTNPTDAKRSYNALELSAKKRFSHHWQASVAYTYSKTTGNVSNAQGTNVGLGEAGQTGNFVDPNHLINMDGRAIFDAPHQLLIQATYSLPHLGGLNISPRYRYQSGSPWGRTVVVRGLAQGTETVRIEPRGTRRNDASSTIDLRLEKTVPFKAGRRLGLYVDIVNLNNQGVGGLREPAGATFGTLSSWSTPRLVQGGARFTF